MIFPSCQPQGMHLLLTGCHKLLSTPQVCGSYPGIKVITSEIDESLGDDYQVIPGIGNFGDRYFCE